MHGKLDMANERQQIIFINVIRINNRTDKNRVLIIPFPHLCVSNFELKLHSIRYIEDKHFCCEVTPNKCRLSIAAHYTLNLTFIHNKGRHINYKFIDQTIGRLCIAQSNLDN